MICPICKEEMTLGHRGELIWYPKFLDSEELWDMIKNAPILETYWECFECKIKMEEKEK